MDAIDNVFDPLRDFAKDSVRLVKRCHKPDRKGNFFFVLLLPILYCLNMLIFLFRIGSEFLRIHQGGVPYCDRFRGDGLCGFLREAHLHPHQQHHCGIWLRCDCLFHLFYSNFLFVLFCMHANLQFIARLEIIFY